MRPRIRMPAPGLPAHAMGLVHLGTRVSLKRSEKTEFKEVRRCSWRDGLHWWRKCCLGKYQETGFERVHVLPAAYIYLFVLVILSLIMISFSLVYYLYLPYQRETAASLNTALEKSRRKEKNLPESHNFITTITITRDHSVQEHGVRYPVIPRYISPQGPRLTNPCLPI